MKKELKKQNFNDNMLENEALQIQLNFTLNEIKKYEKIIDKINNFADKYSEEWCEYDEVVKDMEQLKKIAKGEF